MLAVPETLLEQYELILREKGISENHFNDYLKWLRYFLDFVAKYQLPASKAEQIHQFGKKLRSKRQSEFQQQQANHAIFLYFELQCMMAGSAGSKLHVDTVVEPLSHIRSSQKKTHFSPAGYAEKSNSPEWDAVVETMAAEIKVRHYSRKTLKTYANWSRKFQGF